MSIARVYPSRRAMLDPRATPTSNTHRDAPFVDGFGVDRARDGAPPRR